MASSSVSDSIAAFRLNHGLCAYCGSQLFKVRHNSAGEKELHPSTIQGVVNNGRCLFCYPDPAPAATLAAARAANTDAAETFPESTHNINTSTVAASVSEQTSVAESEPQPTAVASSDVVVVAPAAVVSPPKEAARPASRSKPQDDGSDDNKSTGEEEEDEEEEATTPRRNSRTAAIEKRSIMFSTARSSKRLRRDPKPFPSQKPSSNDDDDDRKPAARNSSRSDTSVSIEREPDEDTPGRKTSQATGNARNKRIVTPRFRKIPSDEPNEAMQQASDDMDEDWYSFDPEEGLTGKRKVTISDGDGIKYRGHILQGNLQKGQCLVKHKHENGAVSIYKGEFAGGTFHGKGKQKDGKSGSIYSGEFANGFVHGKGRCFPMKGGWMYTGEWKKDQRCGYGEWIQYGVVNGEEYRGQWRNDECNGKGELKFEGGGVYVGTFKDNEIHGKGKYEFADGSVYDGQFKDGLRSGYGKMTFAPDGSRYSGQWKMNRREGKGEMHWRDGSQFEGTFDDDLIQTGMKRLSNGGRIRYKKGVEVARIGGTHE